MGAAGSSVAIALLLTPLAIRVARRVGFFDVPVGYKAHQQPTPYLGGAALLCALCGAVLAFAGDLGRSGPLVLGALVLWVLGTIDDRFNLNPVVRVVVEAGVAVGAWSAGIGWSVLPNDAANLALTVAWIVGVLNAFNLMDNMDGAAPTVAAVCASAIGVVALFADDISIAVFALAVAGACAAFLRFNLTNPARIFLGDGGSMPIGFVIATCAMVAAEQRGDGLTALTAAVLLVALPVIDTGLVVVSRTRRHVPVLKGNRDHITHRIAARIGSPRAVAACLAVLQAAFCGIAFATLNAGVLVPASVGATLGLVVLTVWVARLAPGRTVPARPARDASRS